MIAWDERFKIGIDLFDRHHRDLIDIINRLNEERQKGGDILQAIDELLDYAKYHCNVEENALAMYGYQHLDRQKTEHASYLSTINEANEQVKNGGGPLTEKTVAALGDWLVNHIQRFDSKYSNFLKRSGMK